MAQSYTQQQVNWLTQFQQLAMQLLDIADRIDAKCTEYADQTFGSGGANALTDAVVQTVIPQATASQVWGAEGAVVNVLATITSNRGYLEAIRP